MNLAPIGASEIARGRRSERVNLTPNVDLAYRRAARGFVPSPIFFARDDRCFA